MPNVIEKVFLKLTSAVVFDGLIHKAGAVIEMVEHEAKDLLRRGKAVLATEKDHPLAGKAAPSDASVALQDSPPSPVEPEVQAEAEQAPAAPAGKGKGGAK